MLHVFMQNIAGWWLSSGLYYQWQQVIHPFAGIQMNPMMSMFLDHFKLELLLGLIVLLVLVPGMLSKTSSNDSKNRGNGGNFNIFNLF